MDRRQQKTRAAIFSAFTGLLEQKPYSAITVQEIIDAANIGRSTFYAHFESKDELLMALCRELFDHIVGAARQKEHTHGLHPEEGEPISVFLHMLMHLQENDHQILTLLSCESNDFFLRYFKDKLTDLVRTQVLGDYDEQAGGIPKEFLVNHISGSFVEMVQWWIKRGMPESPQELEKWFRAAVRLPETEAG